MNVQKGTIIISAYKSLLASACAFLALDFEQNGQWQNIVGIVLFVIAAFLPFVKHVFVVCGGMAIIGIACIFLCTSAEWSNPIYLLSAASVTSLANVLLFVQGCTRKKTVFK